MSIRAIGFDFGKVVSHFDHGLTSRRLAAYTELPVEKIHAFLFCSPLEIDYESGRITTDEFIRQAFHRLRLRCSEAEFRKAWTDIFWPNEEVCRLILVLKDRYPLVLGSNTNELHAKHFSHQYADVFRHFDGIVYSHEVGARKPNAAFFERCRQHLGVPPSDCVFIDDLPANVAGAQACGWQGIVYTSYPDLVAQLRSLGIHGL